MKILKATIQNFLTIGNAEIELNDRGLLLIVGSNDDDSSANSNGAGKSSLVDAICWAAFGVTARDVTGDDVINERAKKDCYVFLHIEDEGKRYNVTRHRKHKTFKNSLIVSSIDSAGIETDLTKGTDKETQEVVNAIMGCSVDVFTAAVYAGQERMPDLPSMTDKTLKVLIEEAAGIQVLEQAHSVAKKRLGEAKDSANIVLSKVNTLETSINNIIEHHRNTQVKAQEFEDTKKDRAKNHLRNCAPHMAKIKQVEEQLEAKVVGDADLAELEQDLKAIAEYEKARLAEWRKLVELETAVKHATAEFLRKKNALTALVGEIKNVSALVNTPCGECGKPYCEDDLHGAIEARKKTAANNKSELIELKATIEQNETEVAALRSKVAELDKYIAVKGETEQRIAKIREQHHFIANAKTAIETEQKLIEGIKTEAKAIMSQDNPFTSQIAELEDKRNKYTAAMTAQKAELDKALAQVALCEEAVKVFGPAGVRAHILDSVTPFLNARTNEYLGALSDGNAHATWTTLTANAKGEMREKFSIAVSCDTGGSSFKKLSGGEKRKVRLATAMALQDLVASRATKPIQLFIADEIDYALDDSGLERLMTLLEKKARERGTVLIISHQSGLRDWCDQVITVKKEDGYSTVSGDHLKTA